MTYVVIDDQNEVNKILKNQVDWYKQQLKIQAFGLQHGELINKITEIVKKVDEDEDGDYDQYSAFNDIKWYLKSYKLLG